jgi:hypothetical protein
MRCANCDQLRTALEEARDEIRAWRAYEAGDIDDQAHTERLSRWLQAFPGRGYGPVNVLLALIDANGRIVTRAKLIEATRSSPFAKVENAEDLSFGAVSVRIFHLRNILRDLSKAGKLSPRFGTRKAGIRNHHGLGYSIAPEDIAALKAQAREA